MIEISVPDMPLPPEVLEEWDTVAAIARLTGVARSTLQSAIGRGELQTRQLAGGATVISEQAVIDWDLVERKRGRKPRPKPADELDT